MPPAAREPFDTRDALEHAEVAALLGGLPHEHPARVAYRRGAGTLALTHFVTDRPALVEPLKEAFLAGYRRLLASSRGFRPG
jgi:hypothetical protein